MHTKTCCAATGIRTKMSTVEVSLGYLIFLPILLLYAIIALAIIAESFGKFLLPRTKKNSPKISANLRSTYCLDTTYGDEGL